MTYIQKIEINSDGDIIILIPDEILEELGWDIGTTVTIEKNEDTPGLVIKKKD